MAIEINPLTSMPGQVTQGGSAERPQTGGQEDAASRTGKAPGDDQVTLTPEAKQLRALEDKVADLPIVDSQRVDAIRSALASGNYEIDPQRIAGKLMSLERALSEA